MTQSQAHKNFLISDLEWVVMAPGPDAQFRRSYANEKPLGDVLWAVVNEEVAARLAQGGARLRPPDWRSARLPGAAVTEGTSTLPEGQVWIVDIIAPFGGREEILGDFKQRVHPDRPVHFLGISEDGTRDVKVV